MKKKVLLIRLYKNEKAAYGILIVVENGMMVYECRTIENLSKIFPAGTYPIKNEWSPRFNRKLWELYGIKGRSEIKIHVVNYYNDLDGCIGVGLNHADLNDDGIMDLASSAAALDRFRIAMMGIEESEIKVVDLFQ